MRILAPSSKPICGLFAIALATYDRRVCDIEAFFADKKRGNWKGRLYWFEILAALKHFGVKTKAVTGVKGLTAVALQDHLVPGKHYLVRVTGHIFTCRDGILWDQTHNAGAPVESTRSAKRRTKSVLEIKK
jgi:hypothetical protein